MNKKGFSLIELLGTIVILGILMAAATIAITKYIEQSRKQSYDTMEKSAYDAARNYLMDRAITAYPLTLQIDDLVKDGYLEDLIDPVGKNSCTGDVVVEKVSDSTSSSLEDLRYKINVKCSKYKSKNVIYPK